MNLTLKYEAVPDSANVGITKSVVCTGGQVIRLDESIPDESTDLAVALALDVSQIKGLYIVSDQDLTLETNSGSAADDTIALVAGVPLVWHPGCYMTNPLATDVTALYVTNASGAAARLQAEIIVDPTV